MNNVGKQSRLNRLFSHPSGRLCSVAVDHFINYNLDHLPLGLHDIRKTLGLIVEGRPDAVTMHRGIAAHAWFPHAGKVPMILQSTLARPDDSFPNQQIAEPEDAVRFGADALAIAGFVRGPTEAHYLKTFSLAIQQAARFELPVIIHIYPRVYDAKKGVQISFAPEDIAWAVRCTAEVGADVIKVPYCNDVAAYAQIVSECPVPVVAAGGPKTKTFEDALGMLLQVVQSGARGATIGRNVWGVPGITDAVKAVKAVIHDKKNPKEALKGLNVGG